MTCCKITASQPESCDYMLLFAAILKGIHKVLTFYTVKDYLD